MSAPGTWDDLKTRLISGGAMVAIGLLGVWMGGVVFHLMVAAVCGIMAWELVTMLASPAPEPEPHALTLAAAVGGAVLLGGYLPAGLALPLVLAPAMLGFYLLRRRRGLFLGYSVMILLAGAGLTALRDDFGFGWMLWLALVVVVTDVVGYFAGKAIGGPKFWPRVSPKKTWSGTAGGWVGAAVVGIGAWIVSPAGFGIVGISIALSMASQMGDIAESALKRHVGVKDSSGLIPGHGGLFDRFDGMLGAAVFLLLAGQLASFPPGAP